MTTGEKIRKRRLELKNVSEEMKLDNGILLDRKGQFLCRTVDKSCFTCKWHDGFSWVCYNGLSECRADFTDPDDVCKEWEMRK